MLHHVLPKPELAPTARAAVAENGTATLYRFGDGQSTRGPVLLIPSLINRWYVLDLRAGASLVEALVADGFDVFCLDWGAPQDEDRYLSWDDVLARLHRMVRRTLRIAGAEQLALVGYCMGATLSAIYTALYPDNVRALINLAGPIDFEHAGMLGEMVDKDHFDAEHVANAGNVSAGQMQGGFSAMQPTLSFKKLVGITDGLFAGADLSGLGALEAWASDNIDFPGEAYRTYIGDLYQHNKLVDGQHRALGRRVDLKEITCPVLHIVAEADTICPPDAAEALGSHVSSTVVETLRVPGGHVGAVVGSKARKIMYPGMSEFLTTHLEESS
ncbi:MAG: alpha/beta fold hydrolase [Deltaproteobacteria bacterium]|nr:alpha/beta fold hydrolase [Deltaproteobacteria bacterium]